MFDLNSDGVIDDDEIEFAEYATTVIHSTLVRLSFKKLKTLVFAETREELRRHLSESVHCVIDDIHGKQWRSMRRLGSAVTVVPRSGIKVQGPDYGILRR